MANSKPIGGVGMVRYNGTVLPFRGELAWNFQQFQKKKVAGRDGQVHGTLKDPNVPYIEGEFTWDGRVTTRQLEAVENATISVILADGRQLVLRGAEVAGEITPQGDEAKVKLKWEGVDGEEIAAPAS